MYFLYQVTKEKLNQKQGGDKKTERLNLLLVSALQSFMVTSS